MEITTQLALFLANKPGTLAAVCDALAAEEINIYGLTISDTVDHAVVRMVVSDHKRALTIFEECVRDFELNDSSAPEGDSELSRGLNTSSYTAERAPPVSVN